VYLWKSKEIAKLVLRDGRITADEVVAFHDGGMNLRYEFSSLSCENGDVWVAVWHSQSVDTAQLYRYSKGNVEGYSMRMWMADRTSRVWGTRGGRPPGGPQFYVVTPDGTEHTIKDSRGFLGFASGPGGAVIGFTATAAIHLELDTSSGDPTVKEIARHEWPCHRNDFTGARFDADGNLWMSDSSRRLTRIALPRGFWGSGL
jgi:hypothetical protein